MHKKVTLTLLLTLFIGLNSISFSREQENPDTYQIIISVNTILGIKSEDAKAFGKVLGNIILNRIDKNAALEVKVTKSDNEIIQSLTASSNLLILNTYEYFRIGKKIKINPFAVSGTGDGFGDRLLLIARKSSNYKKIKDIKGRSICIIGSGDENSAVKLWLKKLLKQENLEPWNKFFKEVSIENKGINIIHSIFFKKYDAAIISESVYETACKLNPQLKTEIVELFRSERIQLGVLGFITSESFNEEKKKQLMLEILNLHNFPAGKQIINLFGIDLLYPFKKEYLDTYIHLQN